MEAGTEKVRTYRTHVELGWLDTEGRGIESQAEAVEHLKQCAADQGFTVIGIESATTYDEQPTEIMSWGGEPFRNREALDLGTPAKAGRL